VVSGIECALLKIAIDLVFQKLHPDVDCTVVLGLSRKDTESIVLAFTELLKKDESANRGLFHGKVIFETSSNNVALLNGHEREPCERLSRINMKVSHRIH